MNVEIITSLVKVAAPISAGVFASYGIYQNGKDKGKWKTSSKVALGGALLSMLLSVVIFALEYSKVIDSAADTIEKASATTAELDTINNNARKTVRQQQQLQETVNKKTANLLGGIEKTFEETVNLDKGLRTQQGTQQRLLSRSSVINDNVRRTISASSATLRSARDISSTVRASYAKQKTLLFQQQRTIWDMQRSLNPLEPMALDYTIEYPLKGKYFAEYVKAALDYVKAHTRSLGGDGNDEGISDITFVGDSPRFFAMNENCKLFPFPENHVDPNIIAALTSASLSVEFRVKQGNRLYPEWQASFKPRKYDSQPVREDGAQQDYQTLSFDFVNNHLILEVHNAVRTYTRSNGKVQSVLDLINYEPLASLKIDGDASQYPPAELSGVSFNVGPHYELKAFLGDFEPMHDSNGGFIRDDNDDDRSEQEFEMKAGSKFLLKRNDFTIPGEH